jgi:hypothetical protein
MSIDHSDLHDALFGLCQAQLGKIHALEIATRALIASMVTLSPDTSEAFQSLVAGMAEEHRASIDQESHAAFDSTVESMIDLVEAIRAHQG